MELYLDLCQLIRDNKFKATNMQIWSHIHIFPFLGLKEFFLQLTQYAVQIYSFMIPYSHSQISFLREILEEFFPF